MHVLKQSFHDQGIKVDRINVVIQNDSDHQSMAGNTGSGGSGQQSKSSSKKSNMLFSQSSDELAVDPLAWTAMNPNARFHTVA